MSERPQGIERNLDKLALICCVALSLWMMSWPASVRLERATAWAHRIVAPVEWGARVVERTLQMQRENDELRARLAAVRLDAMQIETERERIETLQQRAGFYQRSRGHLIPAVVLELGISRLLADATIRTVGDAELRAWMPVVSEAGLVGRIAQVMGPRTARVQLLPYEDSAISAEVVRSGVTGILRFDGRRFVLDQVPTGEDVHEGDLVITSGLGGTVPRGLPLGRVRQQRARAEDLFQEIEIESPVRFSALRHVYVITRPGPWYLRDDDLSTFVPDSLALRRPSATTTAGESSP